MINYKNIEQTSIEWFEIKWGKIGGTLSKGFFINSDTLFFDILSQHIEDFEMEEGFSNDFMEHGKENEPYAIEYLEKYYNIKFEKSGWLQSEENKLLGISPDGISEDETYACECKCLGRKKHTEIIVNNEIPLEHVPQLIHYFTVNSKLEKLYFICFRAESKKHFIKILTLDSEVNIGTKAKPKFLKINECVLIAKKEAELLLQKINLQIEKLNEF